MSYIVALYIIDFLPSIYSCSFLHTLKSRLMNILKIDATRFRKLVTIISSPKNATRRFIRQKLINTSESCYFAVLVLTHFHLRKSHVMFLQPKSIITSFLNLIVLMWTKTDKFVKLLKVLTLSICKMKRTVIFFFIKIVY